MRKLLTCIFLIGVIPVWSQVSPDSILINERSIDRPLTLHKGQLRISGSYALGIVNKRFDEGGDAIRLSDEGLTSVRHTMVAELKYGVLDYLELQVIFARQSQAIRERDQMELSDPAVQT